MGARGGGNYRRVRETRILDATLSESGFWKGYKFSISGGTTARFATATCRLSRGINDRTEAIREFAPNKNADSWGVRWYNRRVEGDGRWLFFIIINRANDAKRLMFESVKTTTNKHFFDRNTLSGSLKEVRLFSAFP